MSKNQLSVDEFLGENHRACDVAILPRYYGELLTWALHRYLGREGWTINSTLGYHGPGPFYIDVYTGDEYANLLANGRLLVERGDIRFAIAVDIDRMGHCSAKVEGGAGHGNEIRGFVAGVMAVAEGENFYRGKKMEFNRRIRLLNVRGRSWDSIAMDDETKAEIQANTVSFLKHPEQWSKYGIPLRRGVLLAGDPGTGKTVICKAVMAEAQGVTCITTSGYAIDDDDYISELYELAEDLSPSIVFIEDIDLIGQSRVESGYQRGPALLSLLSVLDGIEEHAEIVTIATTNCPETLDKALSQRPSRFDRVIRLTRPSVQHRRQLVRRLCQRIPLEEEMQEYIAQKTESCTPAQVQEIVYSLVIRRPSEGPGLSLDRSEIDLAISKVNGRRRTHIGFASS